MDFPSRWITPIRRLPLLSNILDTAAAGHQAVFLSGGYIRDRLLGKSPKAELDLTVTDPRSLMEHLRLEGGESPFLMDPERATYRIVFPPGSPLSHLDLTGMRAGCIDEDLRLRDFTVNALAIDLGAGAGRASILDPTGGLSDLEKKMLRACSGRSFRDDPLRTLRGVRLAANLGLTVERRTLSLMERSRAGLRRVAGERVRNEIFEILQGPAPGQGLAAAMKMGLLGQLGSSFRRRRRPSLKYTARTAALIGGFRRRSYVRTVLETSPEEGVRRGGLLLLAAFVQDQGAGRNTAELCRRLVLGKKATAIVTGALAAGMPRGWSRSSSRIGRREALRLFRCCDGFIVEAALLAAARGVPVRARHEAAARLLARYRRTRGIFLRPPILTGRNAMKNFRLRPGTELGELLARAREAQDLGRFYGLPGALRWTRAYLTGRDRPD